MLILGVDPDTRSTGIALVDFKPGCYPLVIYATCAKVHATAAMELRLLQMVRALDEAMAGLPGEAGFIAHAVVESQEKYPRDKVRPNDLIHLAQVTGMACSAIYHHHGLVATMPKPREWKGNTPKDIHQKRIRNKIQIANDSGYNELGKVRQGHVTDAIGLAVWRYSILSPSERHDD